MTRLFKSIRWRVQAWHGLMLFAVLAAFGGSAFFFSREGRYRAIDQHLQRRGFFVFGTITPTATRDLIREALRGPGLHVRFDGPVFLRRFGRDGPPPPPSEIGGNRFWAGDMENDIFYHVLWDEHGALLDRSPNAPEEVPIPASSDEVKSDFRTRGEFREHIIAVPSGPRLVVGRSIAREQYELSRLAWLLIGAGAAVMTLGLAGGWWLATRAIRPIQAISDTAGKIAEGSLAERINISDTDNELGRLALTLNATFARLESAFDDQTRAYERQAQFTADASHELRTPVSVVLTQAQSALARERTPEEYRNALEVCQRAAERMRRLVESLLTLARLESDPSRAAAEPCELGRLASEAVEMLRPIAAQHRVELRLDLRPASCLGDAGLLGQVATNLIANAIHYNRPGGKVRVAVEVARATRSAILLVEDTGQGIGPDDLPHIFERFYRADKSRHGNGRTGLGLAITKAIVDGHGGTIHATSVPGQGSTFTVRLPVHRVPRAQRELTAATR